MNQVGASRGVAETDYDKCMAELQKMRIFGKYIISAIILPIHSIYTQQNLIYACMLIWYALLRTRGPVMGLWG